MRRNAGGYANRASQVRKKTSYGKEIQGFLLFAAGILYFFCVFFPDWMGEAGYGVRNVSMGVIGVCAYFIPALTTALSILTITGQLNGRNVKTVLLSALLIFLAVSLAHISGYDAGSHENLSFMGQIAKSYEDGQAAGRLGGGVMGCLATVPLMSFIGLAGTIIIILSSAVVTAMALTKASISYIFKRLGFVLLLILGIIPKLAVYAYKKSSKAISRARLKRRAKAEEALAEAARTQEGSRQAVEPRETGGFEAGGAKGSPGLTEGRGGADRAPFRRKPAVALAEGEGGLPEPYDDGSGPFHDAGKGLWRKGGQEAEIGATEPRLPGMGALPTREENGYSYPPIELLRPAPRQQRDHKDDEPDERVAADKLERTLRDFGIEAEVTDYMRGPAVTRYELRLSPGVKVSAVVRLADDIALALATAGIRIEAPIQGKSAIGIEVPNASVRDVCLREVIESQAFAGNPSKIAVALGKDIAGECVVADIAAMPHILMAGATGAGKSVCINSLIVSILYRAAPWEVKLLMIDPKVVELNVYDGIPHLLTPVVTDPKKAANALSWAVGEMMARYRLFAERNVRNLRSYNEWAMVSGEAEMLPQIVIIIDELADLMMVAQKEIETYIARLAQMARAAGMHLVIATQRPSVNVITGVIKANIPTRLSFKVASYVDSRVILDVGGAEKLLGMGDMLYNPIDSFKPIRVKGAYISERERSDVVGFLKVQGLEAYDEAVVEEIESMDGEAVLGDGDCDELLPQAIRLVVDSGQASIEFIRRRFKVGYGRAGRIIDQMEARGIVGGQEGSKPRKVLLTKRDLGDS